MRIALDGDPTFVSLRQAHIAALSGSLLDGAERGPGGASYVWSRAIPDPTLNCAYGVHYAEQFAWAGAAALRRGRAPAFLAQDAQEEAALHHLFEPTATFAASLMVARPAPVPSALPPEGMVIVRAGPTLGKEFEEVFTSTSDDPVVRMHLLRTYLPAFRRAREQLNITPIHLVLRDARGPAACASLYCESEWAGLYNVGTRFDRQGQGFATALVAAALSEARGHGAAYVFLQCPSGGAVEALYERAGFRTLYRPSLLCTSLAV